MKQQTVQMKYDAVKFSALQQYAGRKEISIEEELIETITRLYEKLVPSPVREYIEMNAEETEEPEQKQKKPKRASEVTQPFSQCENQNRPLEREEEPTN